jgi:hypothetical protein
MRRIFTAIALLGVAAGFAHADYLILRVNLNPVVNKDDKDKNPVKAGGDNDLDLVAFIEYAKALQIQNDPHVWIQHKWGRCWLDLDGAKGVKGTKVRQDTLRKRFRDRFDDLRRQNTKVGRAFLEATQWAVNNGLLDLITSKEQENALLTAFLAAPPGSDEPVIAAQTACKAVLAKLQTSLPANPAAAALKDNLKCNVINGEHYSLLFDAEGKSPVEVKSRLSRLEETYRQFYVWFALRGKELPMPDKKLVALMIDKPRDFEDLSKHYDSPQRIADSFYVPRDNLIVFSAQRLDAAYNALDKRSKELAQAGWNFSALVQGRGGMPATWFQVFQANPAAGNQEYAANQTIALLHRVMAEEAEYAAATHQGTRQLLTASGLLPRGVVLPQWLQSGLPSVFETAKTDPYSQTGAYWPTYGEVNWVYMTYFKLWEQTKPVMLDSAEDALRAVLTDRYFRDAALDPNNPDKLIRARTMAWALAYYLANRETTKLLRYGQELDALPRDLDVDPEAHMLFFARAFDLVDPTKPDAILPSKFRDFATEWYKEMKTRGLPAPNMVQSAETTLKERRPTLIGGKAKE